MSAYPCVFSRFQEREVECGWCDAAGHECDVCGGAGVVLSERPGPVWVHVCALSRVRPYGGPALGLDGASARDLRLSVGLGL